MRTSGETDFRFGVKLKITLEELTYPSKRPQCHFLSPRFLLIAYYIIEMIGISVQFLFFRTANQEKKTKKKRTANQDFYI